MVSDWGLCSKRGTVQGKITAASSHIQLFCGVRSSLQSRVHINRRHYNPAMWCFTIPAVKWWYMFPNSGWVLFAWVILDLSVWLLDEEFIPHSNLWDHTQLCDKQLKINRWKKETADSDKEKISAWTTEAYYTIGCVHSATVKGLSFFKHSPLEQAEFGAIRHKLAVSEILSYAFGLWWIAACASFVSHFVWFFFFPPLSTLPTCHLYGD